MTTHNFLVTTQLQIPVTITNEELIEWGLDPEVMTERQFRELAEELASDHEFHWWDEVFTDVDRLND